MTRRVVAVAARLIASASPPPTPSTVSAARADPAIEGIPELAAV